MVFVLWFGPTVLSLSLGWYFLWNNKLKQQDLGECVTKICSTCELILPHLYVLLWSYSSTLLVELEMRSKLQTAECVKGTTDPSFHSLLLKRLSVFKGPLTFSRKCWEILC